MFILQDVRYRGAYGGRGSAKTRTFAKMTAVVAYQRAMQGENGVILCGREFMNSLEDSSLEEIKQAIRSEPWLADFFEIGEKYVRTKCGRISYIFTGLRHNLDSIKSKARILLAWIDEAESVSEMAWRKLLPTVRESGSEIWLTWNPEKKGSATDLRFRQHQDESMAIVEMNYSDNPWFPDVLEQERLRDKARLDDATYRWIWEGDYLEESEAQVFRGKYQELEFKPLPDFEGPYHGLDFGFAHDPTAAIKCWVFNDELYIEYEAGKVGLELDDTATFLQKGIAGIEQYVIRADSARPESISYFLAQNRPLEVVPVVPFITKESNVFALGEPPLLELAYLNIKHWQSQSDQDNILNTARVPLLGIFSDTEVNKLQVGGSALHLPAGSQIAYIEHSGNAINAGQDSLKELESQMRVAGAKLLDKTVLAMTDSQAKEEQGKEISLLRLYANKFEDALDLALEYVGLWLGIDDVGKVEISGNIDDDLDPNASMDMVIKMQQAGTLSKQTVFNEAKRRGLISDNVEWEDEQARLNEEGVEYDLEFAGQAETKPE
nr:phage terminase large subunit [Glaesserella parasuis]